MNIKKIKDGNYAGKTYTVSYEDIVDAAEALINSVGFDNQEHFYFKDYLGLVLPVNVVDAALKEAYRNNNSKKNVSDSKVSDGQDNLAKLINDVDNMLHYHNKNLNNSQYTTIEDLLLALDSNDTDKIKASIDSLDNLVHYHNKNLRNSQYYMLNDLLDALKSEYIFDSAESQNNVDNKISDDDDAFDEYFDYSEEAMEENDKVNDKCGGKRKVKDSDNSFIEQVKSLANDCGWEADYDTHDDTWEFSVYTSAGQDFFINIKGENKDQLIEELNGYFYSFDPIEEAEKWSEVVDYDEDGNEIREGKNGAPTDWDDLVADMEEAKELVGELSDYMQEQLS